MGSALWLSITTSLVAGSVVFAAAQPWADAWNVPHATAAVRVVGLMMSLAAFATVPLALLRRRLRFRDAALIETGSQVFAAAVGVACASALHSAVALAIGQAAGAGLTLVLATVASRRDLAVGFDRREARELATFAAQVSVIGLASYLRSTGPGWLAARLYGAFTLGIYSRASVVVDLPSTYASTSIFKVIYPLYGRVRDDVGRTRALVSEALTLTTGILWPLFALVAGAALPITKVLLGERWTPAAPLIALLAFAACGNVASGLLTNAAEAFGWMRLIAVRQAVFMACVAGTLVIVWTAHLGLKALIVGVGLSQWLAYGLALQAFVRRGSLQLATVVRTHLTHAGFALGAFAASVACSRLLGNSALAIQALVEVGVGLGVVGAMIFARSWYPATNVLARRLGTRLPAPARPWLLGAG